MNILAIETSCDETALTLMSVVESAIKSDLKNPHCVVRSHIVLSQIELHKEFGGVFPSLAKREHAKNIVPILIQTLKNADMYEVLNNSPLASSTEITLKKTVKNLLDREAELYQELWTLVTTIKKPDIDYICVTNGPGLEPALWVGINFAKALSLIWNIPVVPVNHMEGHIVSVFAHTDRSFSITPPAFPALSLLISGGHTELVLIRDWMDYAKIGQTRDDAVGEAYDKVGRLLDLEYPGGPKVSLLAQKAEESFGKASPSPIDASPSKERELPQFDVSLPRPMIHTDDYDFSFSGLKTAVRRMVEKHKKNNTLTDHVRENIALEFENSVIDVLCEKTKRALLQHNIQTLIIAGGVAANTRIRSSFQKLLNQEFPHVEYLLPDTSLAGDNSLMIGLAGYFRIQAEKKNPNLVIPLDHIRAEGNLTL